MVRLGLCLIGMALRLVRLHTKISCSLPARELMDHFHVKEVIYRGTIQFLIPIGKGVEATHMINMKGIVNSQSKILGARTSEVEIIILAT